MAKSDAYLDGWLAHAAEYAGPNPYDAKTQSRSHAQWASGWSDRFAAVKHGLDLKYDDAAD